MSIKEKTKQALIAYITDELGHGIIDSQETQKVGTWSIECRVCGTANDIRINSLTQLHRNKQNIVCTHCKHQTKVRKFLEKNEMNLVYDYPDLADDVCLIECNSCSLQYFYSGDYFDHYRCYCKLKIKQDERVIYQHLHDRYPQACLTTEYLYYHDVQATDDHVIYQKHKIDIMLEDNDRRFLIEIDDESHFADNRTRAMDIKVHHEFLQRSEANVFLVRIPSKAVHSANTLAYLDDFIETVQNNNPRILLFQVGHTNRYQNHGIPEDECEIIRIV